MVERPLHPDPFKGPCTFLLGVASTQALPAASLPEVAFIGRSNVGKSTLINALFNNRRLARTSNTPGRTQQLNFFRVGEVFTLVDMPGYGYAQAPRQEVAAWQAVSWAYLEQRPTLKRIFILIDSRHGLKVNDREFMQALDTIAVPYQILLTKTDKVSGKAATQCQQDTSQQIAQFPAAYPEVLATSSTKKQGLREVQQAILSAIEFA